MPLPLLGVLAGVLLGLALRLNLPIDWARYTAVGILAALDSLLGAFRAELEGNFDTRVFLSGFFTNALLAAALTFLGDRLGIDIGTTKVVTLIGEASRTGGIDVIGIGQSPSDGLRKGAVVDIDRTVQSIASSVEAAEKLSGMQVNSAFVGVSGNHIASQNSRGMIAVSGRRADISREDTVRAIEAARAVSIPNTREILHVIPRGYVVDGQEGVRDPIGMSAVRLEVETHIVTASSTSVQNLTKCVQRAGVEIDELVLAPLATAEALLSDEDRELGVALCDIGGDTTDVAVFQDGSISHCATIPMGARSVTSDLGLVLRVTPETAESLKLKQGRRCP